MTVPPQITCVLHTKEHSSVIERQTNQNKHSVRQCQLFTESNKHQQTSSNNENLQNHQHSSCLSPSRGITVTPSKSSIFRPISKARSTWCPPLYRNTTLLSTPSPQGYYTNLSSSSSSSYVDGSKKKDEKECQHLPTDFIPPRHIFSSSSTISVSNDTTSDLCNDKDNHDQNHTTRNTQHVAISTPTHQAVKLQPNDIVCGRGAPTNFHPGNHSYRDVIKQHETSYLCAKRSDKPQIAIQVLEILKVRGARFVKREKEGSMMIWVEISEQRAYEKVCQSLREGAPEIRRRMLSTASSAKKTKQQDHHHDVEQLQDYPEANNDVGSTGMTTTTNQILFADDSLFFRRQDNYSPIPF